MQFSSPVYFFSPGLHPVIVKFYRKLPWLRERSWVKKGGAASPTNCSRDNVIRAILFYAGFLLSIIFFSEEFVRALKWLRARLKRSPRNRIIVYPLLLLPIVVGGFIIVTSLIKFSTALTFFYDQGRVLVGCALRTTRRTRASPPLGVTQQELGNVRN